MSALIAAREKLQRLFDPLRRAHEPFARRILAELDQQARDQILHLVLYIARFWRRLAGGAGRSGCALSRSRTPGERDARGRDLARRLAANPKDFESAWKLARAQYWLGTNGLPERDRKAALEAGIAAARQGGRASTANRPEGHFWIAANMGALAESFGLRQGISIAARSARSSRPCSSSIPPSCRDPPIARSAAGTTRCRGCSAATRRSRKQHLRKALAYNPQSVITQLFLAETLHRAGSTSRRRARSSKPRSRRPTIPSGRRRIGGSSSRQGALAKLAQVDRTSGHEGTKPQSLSGSSLGASSSRPESRGLRRYA